MSLDQLLMLPPGYGFDNAATVSLPTPLGRWKFDIGSVFQTNGGSAAVTGDPIGQAVDSGSLLQDGTQTTTARPLVSATVPTPLAGANARSASFDGTNDWLDCTNNSSLKLVGPGSFSAWFQLSAYSGSAVYTIGERGYNGTGLNFSMSIDNGVLWFISYAGVAVYGAKSAKTWSAADIGVWYHVVGVYTNTPGYSWKLYFDGADVSVTQGSLTAPYNSDRKFTIGCEDANGIPTRFFPGLIDDVRFYDQALTPQQVAAIYAGG